PGLGAMTDELLRRGANVTAFEIDYGFARLLNAFFADYAARAQFSLVEGDVLKTWKPCADAQGLPDRFFGNLPYNIAAAIIGDTITAGIRFERCVVTVQKEVGQRMVAKPGTEDYSSFSVLCQWAYDVKTVLDLAGGNFWPKPNVVSRAVLLTKKADFPRCKNPRGFMRLLRALFAARRKTVRNNLLPFVSGGDCVDAALRQADIAPTARAESLTIEQMLALSDAIEQFTR
ncbi:MAG: 16S rRNA (adenine(1518)-N(6)/adenine(1519)-N(6))-dimethyltransferase RsmA, partial [Treponemataceae bacterium]|nr:16S rRNA (adenine(1518)-N(6)/adenine(1519)-N(6))-dimethyltransferase RsmA [Treponemataceae bacterium]